MNESPTLQCTHRVGFPPCSGLGCFLILIACSYIMAFPSTGSVLGPLDLQTKQLPLALYSGSSGQLPGALDPLRNSLASVWQRPYAPQSVFLFHIIHSDMGSRKGTFSWAVVNVKFDLAESFPRGLLLACHPQYSAVTFHIWKARSWDRTLWIPQDGEGSGHAF